MAVKLLFDAGVAVRSSRLLLLCDNPFREHIRRGLTAAGARVVVREQLAATRDLARGWDAVVVALRPADRPRVGAIDVQRLAEFAPGAVVVQFWGDIDRAALAAADVPVWPPDAPAPGHMGILPSGVGPEPIVRLQAGGLKVGEVLCRQGVRARRRPRLRGRAVRDAMRRVLLIGQGPTAESALASLLPRFDVVGLVRSAADEVAAQSRRHGVEVLADASPEGGRGGGPRTRSRRRGRVLL